jgi:thioredoxin 1
MSEHVSETSDNTFEADVLKASGAVLVDFWAPWCSPCKMIAPVLDELAQDFAGQVKICKMNVDNNPRTPSQYGVRGIPNLVLFKDGAVVEQIVGAVPKEQLAEAIRKAL